MGWTVRVGSCGRGKWIGIGPGICGSGALDTDARIIAACGGMNAGEERALLDHPYAQLSGSMACSTKGLCAWLGHPLDGEELMIYICAILIVALVVVAVRQAILHRARGV